MKIGGIINNALVVGKALQTCPHLIAAICEKGG
jgi:hypothetical protein